MLEMKSPILLLLILHCSLLWSFDPLGYRQSKTVEMLGLTPSEAWTLLGNPESLKPVSGDSEYPVVMTEHINGAQLFWYDDRVWQIALDSRWTEKIWGITLGESAAEVIIQLGAPFLQTEDMFLYQMPDIGFPVEARFYLDENSMVEKLIFYRSDF
jgi:hypothetical protein